MSGVSFIRTLLEHATSRRSLSTVMHSLGWLITALLGGIAACLYLKSPEWLLMLLAGLISVSVLVYLTMYIFFASKSPDALRSETFFLTKMAIEKSMRGDSVTGLIDPNLVAGVRTLAAPSVEPPEEKK